MTKTIAIIASALVALGLIIGAAVVLTQGNDGDRFASCRKTKIVGGAGLGGPFELVNHLGQTVTDEDVITGPSLIYFGYTYCPDVCPIDTVRNAEVADILDAQGTQIGLAMITIDPARDTPEVMAGFVENVHDRMIGLTGDQAAVDVATKGYRAYARRSGDDPEYYLMDHSVYTYLVAPGERVLEVIRRTESPEQVAKTVACFTDKL